MMMKKDNEGWEEKGMEDYGDNLCMHAQTAALRKMSSFTEDYMERMKSMYRYSLMWNRLGVTLAENNLNALISGLARWNDAGFMYQRNVLNAIKPHDERKIDRMVMEILKRT